MIITTVFVYVYIMLVLGQEILDVFAQKLRNSR